MDFFIVNWDELLYQSLRYINIVKAWQEPRIIHSEEQKYIKLTYNMV